MNKKLLVVLFSFLAVPLFVGADNAITNFLIGNPCRVPVYNTAFAFPPEGGEIVKVGDSMYFVKTYLPGCENAGSDGIVIRTASQPAFQTPPAQTGGGAIINFFTGNPCLIPVYNTVFAFPPEGGKIVQIGDSLFFVATYMPGCENAGSDGTVIRTAGQTPVNSPLPNTGDGALVNFLIGNSCMVPVYNTDFAFPPEGGKIIKIGDGMYFVRTYEPGCANAGSGETVIRSS